MFQLCIWTSTFYLSVMYLMTGSPPCWRETVTIAQCTQMGDLVLSLLKISPNNPITVFKQVFTRACVVLIVMPKIWYNPEYEMYVFMAVISWSIGEMVRYPFYQFKSWQPILGHLRYNVFIPLYPVGVAGEILCFYWLYQESIKLPQSEKPLTFSMPNTLNVGFSFELFAYFAVPLIYGLSWPPMYMYMFAQRKKFYAKSIKVE